MPTHSPDIAILIPCLNEESTIAKVVEDCRRACPEAHVYVFDNNSTDHSVALANDAGAIVISEHRQGKGNVVRTMFATVDADIYVIIDGDDTYPAEAISLLIAPLMDNRADMVVGDRLSTTYFRENTRAMHSTGNRLVRWTINHLFHTRQHDVMSGFRAMNRDFVKNFPVLTGGFEIETEMTIHAVDKNFRIMEVPVDYRERAIKGTSKLHTVSDGYRVLRTIALLLSDYKPLTFFSIIAALLGACGVGFFIPVLRDYFATGLVPRFPTLIVACMLLVAALMIFMIGIILSAMARKSRREYELLHMINRQRPVTCQSGNEPIA